MGSTEFEMVKLWGSVQTVFDTTCGKICRGFGRLFVPEVDALETALPQDIEIIPVKTPADLFDHLPGRRLIKPYLLVADLLEPLLTPQPVFQK